MTNSHFKVPESAAAPEALRALEAVSIKPLRVFGYQRAISRRYATDGYILIDKQGAYNVALVDRLLNKVHKTDKSEQPKIKEESIHYILPERSPWESDRARLSAVWRWTEERESNDRVVPVMARMTRMDGLPLEDYDAEKLKLVADVLVTWDAMSCAGQQITFWRKGKPLAVVMSFRSQDPRLDDPGVTLLGGEMPPPIFSTRPSDYTEWTPVFPDDPPLKESARKPEKEAWAIAALGRIAATLGGGPDEDTGRDRFVIPTRHGALRFGIHKGTGDWWLYARFDETDRAVRGMPYMSHTGKWNHAYSSPTDLITGTKERLGRISLPPDERKGTERIAEPPRSGDRYQIRWFGQRWVIADTERDGEPLLRGAAHERARILGAAQTVNLSNRLATQVKEARR